MAAAAVGASCPQEIGVWVGSAAPQLLPDPWPQPNFSLQDPVLVLSTCQYKRPLPLQLEANLPPPPPSCITDRNYML